MTPFGADGRLVSPQGAPVPAICEMDASDLLRRIKARELSVEEVVTAFLDRIEAVNPTYNAIVSLRPSEAILAEAREADRRLAAGEPGGALYGLPVAIKDLSPTKGLTTTFGSPIFRDFVPDEDGIATARMRAAGAIIIGKTNTPEFGLGSHSFNEVFGATGNAFDSARSAGGSSGGAAVALALRMLPIADGSDMGGSLRNPAAFNNVYGLRPSFGRVPSLPAGDVFSASLATDGPMARSAQDLARLLAVQAGADPRQPLSSGLPPIDDVPSFEERTVRIAWLGDLQGHLAMEEGILETCEAALGRIPGSAVEAAGIGIDPESLWQSFTAQRHGIIAARYGELFSDPDKRDMLKPEMQWEIENGLKMPALALHRAYDVRTAWHLRLVALFERFDVLALPAAQVWPFPIQWRWPKEIAGRSMDSYHRWMECIAPGTLSGCPVLALPAGFRKGLSTGVQLIAPLGREADLIALASRMEAREASR